MKNYYHLLGVKPEADINEIKKVYKKLAIKFHPDKNNGDEYFKARFQDIQEAFEVLSNEQKRVEYDKNLIDFDNNISDSITPEITLKVNKRIIEKGDDVIFKWSTKYIDKIVIFTNSKVIERYDLNGQIIFNQRYNTNYKFVFYGNNQQVTKSIDVKIIEKAQKAPNVTTINDTKSSVNSQKSVKKDDYNGKNKKTFGQLLLNIFGSIVLSIMITAFLLIIDDDILKSNLLSTQDGKVNSIYWSIFVIIFILTYLTFNFIINDGNNKKQNN